jgi:Holliday junction resolvasome RuvABC endonuclease subunit
MILALDPATQLGYCSDNISGSISFKTKDSCDRIQKFRDWLRGIVKQEGIEMIVYEKPTFGHFNATRVHSHFEAIIMLVAADFGLGYVAISATEIKKWATGGGTAKKDQMIAACVEKLGVTPVDDNMADACWLYDYVTKSGKLKIR